MGLEIERSTDIFPNKLRQTLSFSFHVFCIALLLLNTQKNICRPSVAYPITQKLLNFVTKGEKYWKAFHDRPVFDEGWFT
jgi:hypothetical protein